jgi:hypothetical protein
VPTNYTFEDIEHMQEQIQLLRRDLTDLNERFVGFSTHHTHSYLVPTASDMKSETPTGFDQCAPGPYPVGTTLGINKNG